jgi:hypothetical protein
LRKRRRASFYTTFDAEDTDDADDAAFAGRSK